jgi:hypothetical protein
MQRMVRTYLILIFALSLLLISHESNAAPFKSITSAFEFHPLTVSPFDFLKDLRTSVNDSKFSFLTYRPNQNEFKTALYFAFIFFFFILLIIKFSSPEYFPDLFASFFKKNYLISRITKSKFNISINSILLDIIFISVLSFFFYMYLNSITQIEYYLIFAGVSAFSILQFLIISISYKLFFGAGIINIHLTNILISNRIIGVILAPFLFIITYLQNIYQPIGLNLLLLFLIGIILIRIYRILNQLKFIHNSGFSYIIIYICTFELSVYFVCFKIVSIFINS